MLIQFRYELLGEHVRAKMYCGKSERWLSLCGVLIFSNAEFAQFKTLADDLQLQPLRRNELEFQEWRSLP